MPHPIIFTTNRSPHHQKRAMDAAPSKLTITIFEHPTFVELRPYLAQAEYLISEHVAVIDAKWLAAMKPGAMIDE